MKVFVLSQGRVLAEMIRGPLAAAGHEVRLFDDLTSCVTACSSDKPRALLVPRRVGGADACDVLERVRAEDNGRSISVVLVSPDESDRAPARQWGVAYLPVPFAAHQLLDVVGAATRSRKLILLADDSALIHKHTVPILEEAGYDVVSAMDGEEALRLCDERAPDLVITDVEMPKVDGYQVCKAIKEAPRPAPIPVIICSALGEAQDLERGFDSGADDYLVKPAVPDELVSRIRALVSTFGLESGARERILVADDSPAVRHLIADSLVRQGFAVTTATDGREALDRAADGKFDMVITDYDMPRMNGFELVHALKRDRRTRDLPTMMLTARDTRRDQAQMRAAGLTSYLVKPFSVDKCVAMVERVLAEKRLLAYKEASRLYISDGAVRAAERASRDHELVRAEEREMTILFSDICGFTTMSSAMNPSEVVELLNAFFDVMCPILKEEAADIDKFIGDAIMALFDDLPDADPSPLRAVRAACAMQDGLARWNRETGRDMAVRIGINVGRVVRGDIGSQHVRRDFTVIGDVVNRAQRFEANAPHGGILVGERTYQATKEVYEYDPRPGLRLKGVPEPVNAYIVRGEKVVKLRVLVTDDSLFMRAAIKKLLERDGRFEVIGEAKDGRDAVDKVRALKPDLCTMDFNMPVLDGISALREIMRVQPTPVVMLSAHTKEGARETIEALREGAVDFVTKPSGEVSAELGEVAQQLVAKLIAASHARLSVPTPAPVASRPEPMNLSTTIPPFGAPLAHGLRVVVVAISTGGPAALSRFLPAIPADAPLALLIVQHLPAGFTAPLAERLDGLSPFEVREAADGDRATPGVALIAPGDRHLDIHSDGRLHVVEGPELNGVRPSADITMKAAARVYGRRAVGLVMTGMGRDGAEGLRAIKQAGGSTLVQDQATSVIYGMPRAAVETGCVDRTLPLEKLADALLHF